MDKVLERLKTLKDEESRYAYADAVTNAFLAGQVKKLQEARDLTQEQLAALIGTKQSGISRWLNTGFSTCKVETLRKFAKAYGVRLRISFEEFGTLPTDVGEFTKKRLVPRKFEDDPAFFPNENTERPAAGFARRYADGIGLGRTQTIQGAVLPDIDCSVPNPVIQLPVSMLPSVPSGALPDENGISVLLSPNPKGLKRGRNHDRTRKYSRKDSKRAA